MAGPERALPGDAGHGRLRASHADRDGVINTLKSAYVLGFVTKDELDTRVTQALAARTYAELARVITDLPTGLAAAQPPQGRSPARAALRPADRAAALAAAIVSDDGWLALGAIGSALATLFLMAAQMRTARRPRQPGGQLPGQRPGRIAAGSGPAAAGPEPDSPRASQRGHPGDVRPPSRRTPRPLFSS